MHKLYKSKDIIDSTGCSKATVSIWATSGWIKPCRIIGVKSRPRELFFTQAEYDRIMDAVRKADGHARKIHMFLNRTLHTAEDCTVLSSPELAVRCGCCYHTLHKAMGRLGYPTETTIAVLEEDVAEVKAMVEKVLVDSRKATRDGLEAARHNRALATGKPASTGSITLHIKGLTISLDRKDAEALAEELLAQF